MRTDNENLTKFPFWLRIFGLGKRYFVHTPWWLKKMYSSYTWDIRAPGKCIYLTFDDGPHPIATPFVLDQLKKYDAQATFFCLGTNVAQYPQIYRRILEEGHTVGNHSNTHPNGWRTSNEAYLEDIQQARQYISSSLFRPPYGRITRYQARHLAGILGQDAKIIMWSILSGDFDSGITKQTCLNNILRHGREGSIVVFHDSEKAFPRMAFALPEVLKNFTDEGYSFRGLR